MEYAQVEWEISKLSPTIISIPAAEDSDEIIHLRVRHQLYCTLLDGKVLNAIFQQNSQASCYICLAKPTEMNDRSKRPVNQETLKFGISPLHSWLRFF